MSGIDPALARRAADAVPSIPRDAEGPVFREPWEAQAFAMAVALHARGLFTWPEWAAMLAKEIKRAQAAGDPDTGETYYRHWLNALERIVAAKGVADGQMLARYRDAWGRAAERTRTERRSRSSRRTSPAKCGRRGSLSLHRPRLPACAHAPAAPPCPPAMPGSRAAAGHARKAATAMGSQATDRRPAPDRSRCSAQ
jgi:nitrile hydratase accessory protein